MEYSDKNQGTEWEMESSCTNSEILNFTTSFPFNVSCLNNPIILKTWFLKGDMIWILNSSTVDFVIIWTVGGCNIKITNFTKILIFLEMLVQFSV